MKMPFIRSMGLSRGLIVVAFLCLTIPVWAQTPAPSSIGRELPPKPRAATARWRGLIGEYGPDNDILYILEKEGSLCASFKREPQPLQEISATAFKFSTQSDNAGKQLIF